MKQQLSRPQLVAAVFLALLSPLIRVMPRASAILAGRASWLCALPAFLLLLGFGLFMRRFLRREESLSRLFLRCLGNIPGRAALVLYGLAFLFYAGFILRIGADRLVVTVYPSSGPGVFYTVLTLLCLMAAMGTLRALGRTAVILRCVMLTVLAFAFLFSLPDLDMRNLGPVHWSDVPGILLGSLPLLNVGGLFACFGFLDRYAPAPNGRGRPEILWLGILMLLAVLLCVTVVGSFGTALTLRMSYPFFVMIRDVSLLNLADRIEAMVIVLWVISDFMMCALMLRCAHEALRSAFDLPDPEERSFSDLRGGRWLLLPEGAAVWCAAHFIARDSYGLIPWSEQIIPYAFSALVFLGFPLIWLVGKLRKNL